MGLWLGKLAKSTVCREGGLDDLKDILRSHPLIVDSWVTRLHSVLTVGILGATTVILTLNSYVGDPIEVILIIIIIIKIVIILNNIISIAVAILIVIIIIITIAFFNVTVILLSVVSRDNHHHHHRHHNHCISL